MTTPRYPTLVTVNSLNSFTLGDIKMKFQDDTEFYLIRDQYDISRQFYKTNTSAGSGPKFPEILYDKVRFIHTWTGHADVDTQTIINISSSDILAAALFFKGDQSVNYTTAQDDTGGLGSTQQATDYAPNMPYKYVEGTSSYSYMNATWLIKNVSINDMTNGTSRLTITLFGNTALFDIAEKYDDL